MFACMSLKVLSVLFLLGMRSMRLKVENTKLTMNLNVLLHTYRLLLDLIEIETSKIGQKPLRYLEISLINLQDSFRKLTVLSLKSHEFDWEQKFRTKSLNGPFRVFYFHSQFSSIKYSICNLVTLIPTSKILIMEHLKNI